MIITLEIGVIYRQRCVYFIVNKVNKLTEVKLYSPRRVSK